MFAKEGAGCIPIAVPINCLYSLPPNSNMLFFKHMFSSSIKNDVGIDLSVLFRETLDETL